MYCIHTHWTTFPMLSPWCTAYTLLPNYVPNTVTLMYCIHTFIELGSQYCHPNVVHTHIHELGSQYYQYHPAVLHTHIHWTSFLILSPQCTAYTHSLNWVPNTITLMYCIHIHELGSQYYQYHPAVLHTHIHWTSFPVLSPQCTAYTHSLN